jgi:hypothetical protein
MSETNGHTNGNGHKPKKGSEKTRKRHRPASKEEKAEMVALLPELGSQVAVAEAFDVSNATVSRAAADPEIVKIAKVKKEEIADKFGQLVDKLLSRYLNIADTATLEDKGSTLLGIAADKHRLYSDEPTSITENRNDAAVRDEALKLLEEYKAALNGDEAQAKQLLAQDAPFYAKHIN